MFRGPTTQASAASMLCIKLLREETASELLKNPGDYLRIVQAGTRVAGVCLHWLAWIPFLLSLP